MIDKTNPTPLHFQIKEDLRNQIMSKRWSNGETFPTDKQLIEKYQVSSTTIRRAVSELVNEGLLERRPGKGTFVRMNGVEEKLVRLTGFFEEILERGAVPTAKIVQLGLVPVTEELLDSFPRLTVFDDNEIFCVEKIQCMNGDPIMYVKSFWQAPVGQLFMNRDLSEVGLYQVLEDNNILLEEADQFIGAAIADELVAKELEVPLGSAILVMERIAYSSNRPLEYSYNYVRADRYHYSVKVSRNKTVNSGGILQVSEID
ncbi:GntR family transcriptional regulator [Desulforamulus ruminis]|uniref:UbiC transcription regulator-associated domain-containing protein n=1 Tax=Desulforamulus ruminis (strain ATCC 23193 / DSM 2154 / NCIMB 8452 / DL) TaxID=696281 RepID=F6DQQ5_DESRL|nr:GntR family transcriptional regulator [Desulforamulus ruminis]AEG62052.1 UbiC transcription regulator-associated domain-containing protein [Desulforamulus ruminis DSM 2154]